MLKLFKYLILPIFILWSFIFIFLFQFSFPIYIVEILPEIFLFAIISLSLLGLGRFILKILKLEMEILEKIVFSLSIGITTISIFTTILGFLGLLRRWVFLSLLSILFFSSIPTLISLSKELLEKLKNLKFVFNIEFIFLILTLFILFANLLFTLAPPIFYDSLEFHIAVPNYYILEGKIKYMEGNVFSNTPLYLQMLYLFGMLVRNEYLTPLLTFLMGFILILSLFSFGKRFLSLSYPSLPPLILLSLPLTSFLITTPAQDLPLSLFSFLTFYSYLIFKEDRKYGWLILTGVFLGFSIGIKYQGLYLLLLLPIFMLITGKVLRENIKLILIIFTIAFIISSPWFLKNIIYTGNPFYPMLFKFFGGRDWSDENNSRFIKDLHIKTPSQMLSLIYQVNFSSKIFGAGGIIGPVFLIFLPFYILGKRKVIGDSLFLITFLNLFPFLTTGNIRYSYFSIVILSLLISYGIEEFKVFKLLKIIMVLTVLIIVTLNSFLSFSHLNLVNPSLNLVLGNVEKNDYLKNNLPHYRGIDFINKDLPPDSRILFIYEARTAYVKRKFISATPYDTNILRDLLKKYNNPEEIINELRNRGITHLFFNKFEMERIEGKFDYLGIRNSEIRERFYELLSRLKIVYSSGGIFIYSLF